MSVSTRWIDITAGSDHFEGYLALPKAGKGPGVLILQEIFGVNSHLRAVAEQYALAGYVALAPDIFWRSERRLELGYEGAQREKAIALYQKIDVDLAVSDVGASAKALRALPETTGHIAAVGFCFGGRLAYLAAANGSIDAAVAYYGGGIQDRLEEAEKINVPLQFHYAQLDASIPLAAAEQVKKCFAGRENVEFYLYPKVEHGFNCAERATYNQHAAALAHGRTLTFLSRYLSAG